MPLPVGADAPRFRLVDGEGTPRSLNDLTAAGPALLVFFKTSCPTCRLALPVVAEGDPSGVERLVAWCREGPPGAVVTGVAVSQEEPEGLRGFAVR